MLTNQSQLFNSNFSLISFAHNITSKATFTKTLYQALGGSQK